MIGNLRLTTDRNTEQDWLKTNLAKFTNMLQGQRDLSTVGRLLLTRADSAGECPAWRHLSGAKADAKPHLRLLSAYADDGANGHPHRLRIGEGLIGQCALDKRRHADQGDASARGFDRLGLFKVVPQQRDRAADPVRETRSRR